MSDEDENQRRFEELATLIDSVAYKMRFMRISEEDKESILEGSNDKEILLLDVINKFDGINLTKLMDALKPIKMSSSAISLMITKMWRKKGWVHKKTDQKSQREINITISETGKLVLEAEKRIRMKRYSNFIEAMSLNVNEYATLYTIYDRALQKLSNQDNK